MYGRVVWVCCESECGRCMREGLEWLQLTRAFAGTYVCDCGVVWRLMVLGVQLLWAGGRAFCGEVLWCVVVTPCLCGAQVGDGGSSNRNTPVALSGLSSGVVMVAVSAVRSRAL